MTLLVSVKNLQLRFLYFARTSASKSTGSSRHHHQYAYIKVTAPEHMLMCGDFSCAATSRNRLEMILLHRIPWNANHDSLSVRTTQALACTTLERKLTFLENDESS
jgi:hypothetical protein